MESNLGRKIKILRKEYNLTQQQLAEILHMSNKTVSKWENGGSIPDCQSLTIMSKEFAIPVEFLTNDKIPYTEVYDYFHSALPLPSADATLDNVIEDIQPQTPVKRSFFGNKKLVMLLGFVCVILISFVVVLSVLTLRGSQTTAETVYKTACDGIVGIKAVDGDGKESFSLGVFLSENKLLAPFSVVAGSTQILVYYNNAAHSVTSVADFNAQAGIAVINSPIDGTLFAVRHKPKAASAVYSIGFPDGDSVASGVPVISEGVVSASNFRLWEGATTFAATGLSNFDSVLLNSDCELLGVYSPSFAQGFDGQPVIPASLFAVVSADYSYSIAEVNARNSSYSVVFKDWDNSVLATQTVTYGGSATAPDAPKRSGNAQYEYVFAGWDADFSRVTQNTVVTAVYTPKAVNYALSVNRTNGGKVSVSGAVCAFGSSVSVIATPDEGFVFSGFYDSSNKLLSTNLKYTFTMPANDVVIFAVFQPEQ
ncbi:MAG: helix-turn-helix domain-containing protein [Clostridia bacterium]|nr:helix-turn-helix domain-containing protein [Clostridia bacterium]